MVVFLALPLSAEALTPEKLRVEYASEPLGLDVVRPRFSWIVASPERGARQTAYEITVANSAEELRAGASAIWTSGEVPSDATFGIEHAGPALESGRRYFWRVRVRDELGRISPWSDPAWWQMGLLESADWQAKWIGSTITQSPLLRTEFEITKPVVRATAYAFGLGWYQLRFNGRKVGDQVLTPVNSNYERGLFYDTYDVTDLVRAGRNAVGVWLGLGYGEGYSKYGYRWTQPLIARVQIELLLADGSKQMVITDEHWKTAESPITADHIYHGETYDARREKLGWDEPGFNDSAWQSVELRNAPAGPLKSCPMPPIKVVALRRPERVTEPKPGLFVFDLGQNIAGWTRLRVRGPGGTQVMLRHAEDIHPDGTLDVTTNRSARATDTYVLKGDGEECYEPRFTYHGFRYVEVSGYPGQPTLDDLTGCVVHAAVEDTGRFHCSDPLLNRIHENFRWALWNNLMGIPTDTAARDERTPCQMDSLAVEEAAIANFGMSSYYAKWLHDIRGDVGLPNWVGDQVVLPWLLYENYGDKRLLAEHFPNMKRVVDDFVANAEKAKYWAEGFGDWAAPSAKGSYEESFSEGEIVATAFFYRCADLTARAAGVLNATEDAVKYAQLAAKVRDEFNAKHFRPATHTYGSGRQVTAVLPLAFGLVPAPHVRSVAEALRERVVVHDREHLDTGIFGTRYLFEVLADHGLVDTAFTALTRTTYPSYGNQIELGATATWEQWSFHGGMQTHDHAMFAGPGATFYSRLGGIRAAAPGFREVIIRPEIPHRLERVDCAMHTIAGTIKSSWEQRDRYVHRVTIPANVRATVFVPAVSSSEVREGEGLASEAKGVRFLRMEDGRAVFAVESGTYLFTANASAPR